MKINPANLIVARRLLWKISQSSQYLIYFLSLSLLYDYLIGLVLAQIFVYFWNPNCNSSCLLLENHITTTCCGPTLLAYLHSEYSDEGITLQMTELHWWIITGLNSQHHISHIRFFYTCHSNVLIPVPSPCDNHFLPCFLLLVTSQTVTATLSSPANISMGINENRAGCQPNRLAGLVPKMLESDYPIGNILNASCICYGSMVTWLINKLIFIVRPALTL